MWGTLKRCLHISLWSSIRWLPLQMECGDYIGQVVNDTNSERVSGTCFCVIVWKRFCEPLPDLGLPAVCVCLSWNEKKPLHPVIQLDRIYSWADRVELFYRNATLIDNFLWHLLTERAKFVPAYYILEESNSRIKNKSYICQWLYWYKCSFERTT